MEEDENQEGSTVTTQITASALYGWLTFETVLVGEGRVEERAKII